LVVVVTRYFGGVKLGTGGLIRAYGGAARECLKTAETMEVCDCTQGVALVFPAIQNNPRRSQVIPQAVVALNFGYDIMGAMFTLAERFSVLSTTYEDNGSISVRVR